MRRKMLGAILLPLPFAALPVVVVIIGAVFGPEGNDQLVRRESPTSITIQERVLTDGSDEATGLARISSPAQFEVGCEDHELRSES